MTKVKDDKPVDWWPEAPSVLRDPVATYDWMRENRPVAYSEFLGWSLFRHEDLLEVLHDPSTYSNAVSAHLSIPNGVDPPKHGPLRQLIDRYFEPEKINSFEPVCRRIAANLVEGIIKRQEVEFISEIAKPFAIQVQCAFLGWPPELHEPLRLWTEKNQAATLAQDREAMAGIAREFAGFVQRMLRARREADPEVVNDVTASLLRERVSGRPLTEEEITSILRNWTVGEVGTISTAIGNLAHFLCHHSDIQEELRRDASLLPTAIEEILRIHGPLVANRRITTRPVEIRGEKIDAGERISLIWVAANRDGRVFEAPERFRWDRDQSKNLLYGAGIHACPGAPLAQLQLHTLLEELLNHTTHIEPSSNRQPSAAAYPVCGWSTLPLKIKV